MSRAADAAPAHEQVHERSQKSWYFAGGPDIPGMTMTSKALRGRTDIAPFITRLLGLGLLTLMHVIGWMELLPIDFANVLNGCFWDAVGRRRDAHE